MDRRGIVEEGSRIPGVVFVAYPEDGIALGVVAACVEACRILDALGSREVAAAAVGQTVEVVAVLEAVGVAIGVGLVAEVAGVAGEAFADQNLPAAIPFALQFVDAKQVVQVLSAQPFPSVVQAVVDPSLETVQLHVAAADSNQKVQIVEEAFVGPAVLRSLWVVQVSFLAHFPSEHFADVPS